ncbi:Cytochrome b-c1 complex subunit 7 [Malassezia sp. CBS 17886]|nr:Cytochrome b-c1 complex subunit 7 [Malassezia sp. CBS 17886]
MSQISFAKYIQSSPSLHKFLQPVANAYAHIAGYRQMGLLYDDLLMEENHPTQKGYDRVYRFRRAMQLSVNQRILPKNEWLPASKDVRYLSPLVEQVRAADAERLDFDTMKVKQVPEH